MRKGIIVYFILGIWCFLLSASLPQPEYIRPMVTKVEVHAYQDHQVRHHVLYDEEDMRLVLNYLRAADTHKKAGPFPVSEDTDSITVRVCLTGGKCHVYQQIGSEYLRRDNTRWMRLDPEFGKELEILEKSFSKQGFSLTKQIYF